MRSLRSARSTRPAATPLFSVTVASTSISAAPKPRSATCQPVRDLPRYDPSAANSHLPAVMPPVWCVRRSVGVGSFTGSNDWPREAFCRRPHQPQSAFGRNVQFHWRREQLAFLEEGVAFPLELHGAHGVACRKIAAQKRIAGHRLAIGTFGLVGDGDDGAAHDVRIGEAAPVAVSVRGEAGHPPFAAEREDIVRSTSPYRFG